jgi:hypothetical protein
MFKAIVKTKNTTLVDPLIWWRKKPKTELWKILRETLIIETLIKILEIEWEEEEEEEEKQRSWTWQQTSSF